MNRALGLFAISAILLASPAAARPRPAVERIGQPSLNGAPLPFSDAVRVGDILYLSGQIGLRPDGSLPPGIAAQARQVMDNIGAVLAKSGLGWSDVAKCTVMLDSIADWPAFNQIYVSYFPDKKFPARSAFGADGLALGALVEVECLAHAPARGEAK